MRAHLWQAIHELMDIAESAAEVLDNYADFEDDEHGWMVPNRAASYQQHLIQAVETLGTLMETEVPQ